MPVNLDFDVRVITSGQVSAVMRDAVKLYTSVALHSDQHITANQTQTRSRKQTQNRTPSRALLPVVYLQVQFTKTAVLGGR